MHRYFESRLQRALFLYAVVPLLIMAFIGSVLMFASWRHSVVGINRDAREQAAEKLAAVSDDFSQHGAATAHFLAKGRDMSRWQEDDEKRGAAFARLYEDVGHTGADFYVVDKDGDVLLGSREKLPKAILPVKKHWGIWQRLGKEPFTVCQEFLPAPMGQDLLCGRAIVVDGEVAGYLLYDIPAAYLNSLASDSWVPMLLTDHFGNVRLEKSGERFMESRKLLGEFATADNELVKKGKEIFYVTSTPVPFGGEEYRLYAVTPVTDLLVRYIIGAGAIVLAVLLMIPLILRSVRRESKLTAQALDHLTTIAELRELESQFNPHFLFNTLENIKFMVRLDPGAATEMIMALSALLRYSIAEDGRQVALQEDIKYLASYMKIQKYRFGSRLDFTMEIDKRAETVPVPKLLFQPLLENAIKYGEDEEGNLRINFCIEWQESQLNVRVKDAGGGIAPAKLAELQALLQSSTNNSSHKGLFNVQRRLQLLYGEACGLKIDCPATGGTEIHLCLPLLKKESQDA
ncbi:cache domain-containing sensor histidine kinase [Selenomonas ruminantium]|uniref:Histidine kinase-, DNA gyrase B-, and HSP90-like ATPase n=1 Tax=Selenomonas ruminantium TaxID=971 RepID=A0A1K1N3F3_SELRU|nr:sensor histidine kinase [Selenomonas ruminantium]SFW29962.1 Histidine kinase-, DNA gyrase B-, and HSP90-like ATPase [Selenomonas ruminantium]